MKRIYKHAYITEMLLVSFCVLCTILSLKLLSGWQKQTTWLPVTISAFSNCRQARLCVVFPYVSRLTLMDPHCQCPPRCCALQADSEELRQAWINAVQGSIDMAYRQKEEAQESQVI